MVCRLLLSLLLPGGFICQASGSTPVRLNRLIEKLKRGDPVFGIFVRDFSLDNAAAVADAPLDFVVVDGEHGAAGIVTLRTFLQGMLTPRHFRPQRAWQPPVVPVIRPPQNGGERLQFSIKQLLDVGAFGLMVPHVQNRDDAAAAVRAARYPQPRESRDRLPEGIRGVGPRVAARYWGLPTQEYMRRADLWPLDPSGELLLILQIEDVEGVRNIEEIVKVPGIGDIFLGTADLAVSLGYPVSRIVAEVEDAIQRVLQVCQRQGIACGIPVTPENVKQRIRQGFRILTVGTDEGLPASVVNTLRHLPE